MKLYVMRHGPAEDQTESGVDGDRPLSAPGRERVRSVTRMLSEIGEEPMHVVTSPLVRSVQTAEIVAVMTKLGDRGGSVEVRRHMAPGGDGAKLVHLLAAEGKKRVMLVGHEPDLSGLVAALLGSFGHAFDKAMIVGIHVAPDARRTRLRFILHPKTLELEPDLRSEG